MLFVIFSLVAFNNVSLSLIFVNLITMCLGVFLLRFILPGSLCASCTWVAISFPMLGKFSTLISQIFSHSFLSLFSFWDPYNVNVCAFNVVLEVSQAVFISFHSFFFILFHGSEFHHSVFQVTYLFFCLSYSVIDSF